MSEDGDRGTESGPGADGPEPGTKRRRRRTRAGGSAAGGAGVGAGASALPPNPLLQMVPLLMAMGGSGFSGRGAAAFQIQLLMWLIETWLDYLAAVQDVCQRSLDRLHDLDSNDGRGGGESDGDDW